MVSEGNKVAVKGRGLKEGQGGVRGRMQLRALGSERGKGSLQAPARSFHNMEQP